MKLGVAALAALAVAAQAGVAQARDIRAAGPVAALGTTGYEVAFAARTSARCAEIRVWHTADRGVRRYASHCWPATSTGSGVTAVAVAGRRALWLTYTGGNVREWSLWTKTRTSSVKRLRLVARDVDAPPPLVVGSAWDDALPYALDRTIVVLRPSGARAFAPVTAPDRVVALSAHSGGYAAILANGDVFTISPAGLPLREFDYGPREAHAAVATSGAGVLIATRDALFVHQGRAVSRVPMPLGWRFAGYSQGLLAYTTATDLRIRRTTDGRDVALGAAADTAQLGRLGIAYARGSTVSWHVRSVLAARAA